jgi:hypothetical protein
LFRRDSRTKQTKQNVEKTNNFSDMGPKENLSRTSLGSPKLATTGTDDHRPLAQLRSFIGQAAPAWKAKTTS